MADRLAATATATDRVFAFRCTASYVWFRVGLVDPLDLVAGGAAAVPVAGRQPELVPGVGILAASTS